MPRSTFLLAYLLTAATFLVASACLAASAEIGADDFAISADGDALQPAMAYNSVQREYLVVWSAPKPGGSGREIFGQRLDAVTGAEVGPDDFRISFTGSSSKATLPRVAYDPVNDRYLVVWRADDPDFAGLAAGGLEAISVLVEADGSLGGSERRISFMNDPGESSGAVSNVDVAFGPVRQRFLVVWDADSEIDGQVDGETEIFAREVSAAGVPLSSQLRISAAGGIGDATYSASAPAVAYAPSRDAFLVAWQAKVPSGLSDDQEIFGQLLSHGVGPSFPLQEAGGDDFRISDTGGDEQLFAIQAAIAHDPIHDEFLVVWSGSDDVGPTVENETEIFGQRLAVDASPAATEVGANDFVISAVQGHGTPFVGFAFAPAVAFDAEHGAYLVAWSGDGTIDEEFDVYGQFLLGGSGAEVGEDDFRISTLGAPGDQNFFSDISAAAYADGLGTFLVAFDGNEEPDDASFDIHGQLLLSIVVFADGFESGDITAWSGGG